MNRRKFIKTGATGLAASALNQEAMAELINGKPKRVGLIGTGWYGKADLLRLIQVAPVDVVSLCDVDSTLLSEAAEIVAGRQKSRKKPRTFRTTARCSRKKISILSLLQLLIIGTHLI